jgi:hypothetical protein
MMSLCQKDIWVRAPKKEGRGTDEQKAGEEKDAKQQTVILRISLSCNGLV